MFKTLRNAFKIKDIRDRILYTFFIMIVIRIGSQLPIPGVDRNVFAGLQIRAVTHLTSLMQLPAVLSIRCLFLH